MRGVAFTFAASFAGNPSSGRIDGGRATDVPLRATVSRRAVRRRRGRGTSDRVPSAPCALRTPRFLRSETRPNAAAEHIRRPALLRSADAFPVAPPRGFLVASPRLHEEIREAPSRARFDAPLSRRRPRWVLVLCPQG